jgi:hypothetical protein
MSKKLQRYIEKQPQIPDGFQYKTCILVSDKPPVSPWCIAMSLVGGLSFIERKLLNQGFLVVITSEVFRTCHEKAMKGLAEGEGSISGRTVAFFQRGY